MPTQVFEEPLELEIDILEAGPPHSRSYPYPSLSLTSRRISRTFRSYILENSYLRVTIVPALGGRIWSIFDKRVNRELIDQTPIEASGPRGAELSTGIRFTLQGVGRLTDLAATEFDVEEAEDEVPGSLWLAETVNGTGLSWHLHLTLEDDAALIRVEGRVLNRAEEPKPYNPGFLLPEQVRVQPVNGAWAGAHRFENAISLAPHQLDTWTVHLIPVSAFENPDAVSPEGALKLQNGELLLQSTRRRTGCKVVLLDSSGQTLESPADLHPEQPATFALGDLVPQGVAVLDPDGKTFLRFPIEPPARRQHLFWEVPDLTSATDPELWDATASVSLRAAAHLELARRALFRSDQALAAHHLEQTLLYNGEDHLAWWLKAAISRTDQEEEQPELLNAHFLAPLEPMLRAEAFLRQPQSMTKDPSSLVKPLAEQPENLLEVACILLENGLVKDAARWIDEALRHADLPMLRYLRAWSHLQHSGLDFEAAEDVRAAGAQPLGPPYPWRLIEKKAIAALASRFPKEERLQQLLAAI